MSMSLYQINEEITNLIDQESGEVKDFETFETLSIARDVKIENTALYIKNLNAEVDAIKAEELKLAERRKAAESHSDRLKDYLFNYLNGEKFSTAKVSLSFRSSKAIKIDDETAFIKWAKANNAGLLTFKEPTISKTKIKEALGNGEVIEGASVGTNTSLIIK